MNIEADRIAAPYVRRDRDLIESIVPPEIERVTVLARTGQHDFTVRLWIGSEVVGMSTGTRSVVIGVEQALHQWRVAA